MIFTLDGTPANSLTFGTMQFGGNANERESHAMFQACRNAGINHYDTAWAYTEGRSETLLGGFIGAFRERLIIATKVAYTGGASAKNIRAQFDESRRRLGLEMIDLLYLHRFDPVTPLEESIACLSELQSAGAIRYIGLSNFAAWQVMKAQTIAAAMGTRIDVIQPMYSLVKRQAEVELFPMAADQDLFIAAYSPLGGGLLTGKYASGGSGRLTEDKRYQARYGQHWMTDAATGLTRIATREGTHPATLAVAWAAQHPARPSPIISARSSAQLAPSLTASGYRLSQALRDEITALTPPIPPATDRIEEA